MSIGLNSLYPPKKKDYPDLIGINTRGPVTQSMTTIASDAQTMPRAPMMSAQNPSVAARQTTTMNDLSNKFKAGTAQMQAGVMDRTPDPQVVQAARERAAMAQAGGSPLSQINAGLEGRTRGMQIATDAVARATPESRSPIAGMSPLAGQAAEMTAGADRARMQREQETADYHNGIKKWNQDLKADTNGNGIPDRDEAVATNFGKFGINTIGQLDSMNSKYNIYKQAYNQDAEAQKTSRPMTFEEFAKNEYENFKTRPLYGVPDSGNPEGGNSAFEDARQTVLAARQQQATAQAEQRAPRVEQARQQGLMQSARAQALAQGATPAQANQYGLAALQNDLAMREAQKLRDDQASVLAMQDAGQTKRAGVLADAQKYGADAGVRQAEAQAEGLTARQREASAAQMEQLKMKLADPVQRVQTIGQLMELHPDRASQSARLQAEQQFIQAYPNAPISQVQAAGERAAQSAITAAIPMWNAIVTDPQMQTLLPGQGGQSPLRAYTPPTPSEAMPSPSAGAVPGADWKSLPPAYEDEVIATIKKLEQFNGGKRPTRAQIEEQLLADGYAIDPVAPGYKTINQQIDEYLKSGDKKFTTPIKNPPLFDTTGAIN